MTTTITYLIVFAILFLFTGHFSISFNPFSISLPYWNRSVGLLLVIIGFMIYNIGERASGYKDGFDDAIKTFTELIEKKGEKK